jgi:hypothetical protein
VTITREYGYVRLDFERPGLTKSVFVEPANGGYAWFAEADTHYGPLTYEISWGTQHETVYITYSLHNSESGPGKGRYVSYAGPRPGFPESQPDGLPLADVLPLIKEWKSAGP